MAFRQTALNEGDTREYNSLGLVEIKILTDPLVEAETIALADGETLAWLVEAD